MARPKTLITKAQFAAEMGLTRGRVSQLCKQEGFPTRADGKLDRELAARWYRSNIRPQVVKTGRTRKAESTSPADETQELIEKMLLEAQREALGWLRDKAGELPGLLMRLGAPMAAVMAIIDAFDCLFWSALGANLERLYGEFGPDAMAEPDYRELAESAGLTWDDAWEEQAYQIFNEAYRYLEHEPEDPILCTTESSSNSVN